MLNRDTYREKEKIEYEIMRCYSRKSTSVQRKKMEASMTSSLWIVVEHFAIGDTDAPSMDLGLLPFAPLLGILRHMVIKGIKGITCGYIL